MTKASSKKCPDWADPIKYAEVRKWEILKNVCRRLFGISMFHHICIIDSPFESGSPCYCCKKPSVKRIWANIWGLATQFDVCQKHTFYHGRNTEDLVIEIGD